MARKILIIDDSSTIRSLQSLVLRGAGFETDTASNGIEALEKIYTGKYDLILADVNMPKMDGLRLVRTLREQPEYADLPIIIITSESEEEDRMRGIEAGANLYMVKPTQGPSLVQHVRMLLGG